MEDAETLVDRKSPVAAFILACLVPIDTAHPDRRYGRQWGWRHGVRRHAIGLVQPFAGILGGGHAGAFWKRRRRALAFIRGRRCRRARG
jgi:hypothetical protein